MGLSKVHRLGAGMMRNRHSPLLASPRHCGSSKRVSSSDDGSKAGDRAATPPKGFCTAVRFKLAPGEVTDANVPSAREAADVLPSLKDLHAQLPSARELERTYIDAESVLLKTEPRLAVGGKANAATASSPSTAAAARGNGMFVKATDPLEDFLDARGSGTEASPVRAAHVLLAYRALAWGTLYAIIGVAAVFALCMQACGYASLADLRAGVRAKVEREEARLRDRAELNAEADGGAVVHYTIDLSNPTEAYRQARAIWDSLQSLAEGEAGLDEKSVH